VSQHEGVVISDAEGAPIGVAVILRAAPAPGCATVPFLAIDPARRFRGLGGEAGIALDRHLRDRGFEKIYASVPDRRGLAVYFWLRLGFRPLTTPESPGPLLGLTSESKAGIWMLRDRE
jgi:GNAT superfamily N-acetyltransferase